VGSLDSLVTLTDELARLDAHDAWEAGIEFLEVLTWNLCTGKNAKTSRNSTNGWVHARLPGVASIPSDWSITRLTDVALLASGHTPSRAKREYWQGDIPWISLADIQRLGKPLISGTAEYISGQGLEKSSARLLPAGTVVLSRDASIGYTSVMDQPMATSQHFANFVCSDLIKPRFLYWLFTAMKEFLEYTAVGSTNIKTLYMPFFQNMQIALPPLKDQEGIAEDLWAVYESINMLRERVAHHVRIVALIRESRIGGRS
jgi:type I restriction enzyme S subunit